MSDVRTGTRPKQPESRSLSFVGPHANLFILVALANLFVFILLGFTSYANYQNVRETAANETRSLNSLLAENVTAEFNRIKLGLEVGAAEIARLRRENAKGTFTENDILVFLRQRLPMLENMGATDANGTMLYSANYQPQGISIADRSYFVALRNQPQQGVLISESVSGRLSGKSVLIIALPIIRQDGRFDGVVFASIAVEWFIQKFGTVDVGHDRAVVLRGDASRNFDLLARYRPTGKLGETTVSDLFRATITANPAQGTYEANAGNDKIHRMFSYQKLEGYPLITLVGLSTATYMAEWRSQAIKLFALALAFALTTGLGSWAIMRAWRSRIAAEQEITMRKQIEKIQEDSLRQLGEARDAAEQANQSKSRFLAAASHDLRQPMQAISLFVDALGRTSLSEDQKSISAYLTESTHALGDLLNVLLDISRLDARVVKPCLEALPVEDLASRIETDFSVLAAAKSLRFMLCFPFGGMALNTDSQLVMRLLGNLIGNAIKYTEQGGILVAIRRRGNQALIQVWDTGMGVSAEHVDIIFEEYIQVGNPERDRTKGLGLGLAIAKRIATLLKTQIVCRSRPGKGSVFEFCLPLAPPAEREAPTRIASPVVRNEVSPAGRRVVLVEDDLMVGAATKLALESCGMTVTRYATAEEALEDSASADADFYISDLRLPGLNGVEFLDAIQQRSKKPIKALIVTGDTSADRIAITQSAGWPVLFKPIDLAKLISAMASECQA
jgi:signal transduction histidine kinase/CheY-like chemotaxis protein